LLRNNRRNDLRKIGRRRDGGAKGEGPAATRALEIDPSLAEAETSLATAKFNYDWDWAGAAEGFKKAMQLDPSYATAYQRYSLYLSAMGKI